MNMGEGGPRTGEAGRPMGGKPDSGVNGEKIGRSMWSRGTYRPIEEHAGTVRQYTYQTRSKRLFWNE